MGILSPMEPITFPDVCDGYSFDDYLHDNDINPEIDFTYGWNDCRMGEVYHEYREQNQKHLLLKKEYAGFESLTDMLRDVEECRWLPDNVGGEYQGTVELTITYKANG